MKKQWIYWVPACVTAFIFIILFAVFEYVPFGDQTLATMDADICYLDYFAYLKDVLCGKNSIAYSFSKMLGGTNIAVFSYYLSSPFHLLVVFFRKENLQLFFQLMVALKLSAAASAFCFYLVHRYGSGLDNGKVILLSVSYALCQYNIAQCSNIMWLDGVYMLPLLLYGVWRVVRGAGSRALIFSAGAAMLFNWYTGAIDCLFSAFYFLLEAAVYLFAEQDDCNCSAVMRWKRQGKAALRYGMAMVTGVLLSSVLFVPTLFSLTRGRGSIDWKELTLGITGEIPGIIQSYILGGKSNYGSVSLFCGSMAIIACIGCFLARSLTKKEKITAGCVMVFMMMLFYWRPFCFAFSLLKSVGSYWYRYSYVGIFLMLYTAAFFYAKCDRQEMSDVLLKAAALFSTALLVLLYVKPVQNVKETYLTVVFTVFIALLMIGSEGCRIQRGKKIFQILTAAAVCMELTCNTSMLMNSYHMDGVKQFQQYAKDAQQQVDEILHLDDGIYRISQTLTRNEHPDNLTAHYNEPLAYGYRSVNAYVSDPDYMQKDFLARVGYPINSNNMSVTNDCIIAADSLMGVKYVLSPYPISGLKKLDRLSKRNEKTVYQNPFCLPFAFRYDASDYQVSVTEKRNPFEYQNNLFGRLIGKEKEVLYEPVSYEAEMRSDYEAVYHLNLPEGNYAIYGNLPWKTQMNALLKVNGSYETGYAKWMSPSVFYIPVNEKNQNQNKDQNIVQNKDQNKDQNKVQTAEIYLTAEQELCVENEQFYALNLDRFKEVTRQISQKGADNIRLGNGKADVTVDQALEGEMLFTSIPYDKGWKITVNGKYTKPQLFEDCFMAFPLHKGKNVISMRYHVPALRSGVLFSMIGIVLSIMILRWEKYWQRRSV